MRLPKHWKGPWHSTKSARAYLHMAETAFKVLVRESHVLQFARVNAGSGTDRGMWRYPEQGLDLAMEERREMEGAA